jgi:hypothetical protein
MFFAVSKREKLFELMLSDIFTGAAEAARHGAAAPPGPPRFGVGTRRCSGTWQRRGARRRRGTRRRRGLPEPGPLLRPPVPSHRREDEGEEDEPPPADREPRLRPAHTPGQPPLGQEGESDRGRPVHHLYSRDQGVTKRCRLSLLTNSALVIRVQMIRVGGSCGVSANEYSCARHVTWSPNELWRSTSIFNLL